VFKDKFVEGSQGSVVAGATIRFFVPEKWDKKPCLRLGLKTPSLSACSPQTPGDSVKVIMMSH
jgi:hypothetical protein